MKAKHALILWNPADHDRPGVKIIDIRKGDDHTFSYSSGAAYRSFQKAKPKDQAIMLMALSLELIVFYGLPGKDVDEVFKQVREYRQHAFLTPAQLALDTDNPIVTEDG